MLPWCINKTSSGQTRLGILCLCYGCHLEHLYSHLEKLCFEMKMVLMFHISPAHMHTCLSKLTCKYMCIGMKCVTSVYFSLSHMW